MIRIIIIVIVLGCVVIYFGIQEYLVSAGTTVDPQTYDLYSLETNTPFKNNHAMINNFWALYPAAIYQYQTSEYDNSEPTDATKVDFTYYPVISEDHEFITTLWDQIDKYGDVEDIPDEEFPSINDFRVLVKTERFATVGDIPMDFTYEDNGLSGLFINKIKKLKSDEIKLLQESFPDMNFGNVLILEEGRKPQPVMIAYGIILGGVLLVISPLIVFVIYKQKQKAKQEPAHIAG